MRRTVNLGRFDLASLRLFIAIVDGGSLTAGAERHGISLAAASKRIAELESHVGVALLVRGKRGIAPTAAGQTLLQHAIGVVARLEQLAVAMADFHDGTRGHLRLWANTSAFGGFLPELLAAYSKTHPAIRIDLEDALSEEAARAVAAGVAELAVIGENTPCPGLQTLVCNRDELMLLMPAGHALAAGGAAVPVAAALEHDFVALGHGTSLSRQVAAAALAAGAALRIRVHVRSFDAMCRMVAAGLGLAILPRAGAMPHLAAMGLALAPLAGMPTERCLLVAMRDRAALSPAAAALVGLIERRMAVDNRPP